MATDGTEDIFLGSPDMSDADPFGASSDDDDPDTAAKFAEPHPHQGRGHPRLRPRHAAGGLLVSPLPLVQAARIAVQL